MKKPVVFGFYGESNTGKTSLVVKIIKKLKSDGYKIAAVKITDKKIGMDSKGKDTWKYSQAGSKLTVLSSKIETDFIVKENKEIDEIIRCINTLGYYDVILVEGAHDKNIPKIRLGNIKERENTILSYTGNFDNLIKNIKKEIAKKEHRKKENLVIKVNGKKVPLTEFPSEFIKNTIVGMLRSLRGVDEEIENVEITF